MTVTTRQVTEIADGRRALSAKLTRGTRPLTISDPRAGMERFPE